MHGLDIDLGEEEEEQESGTGEEEREVLEKPAESEEKVREEKERKVSIDEEVKIAVAEKIRANAAWTMDSGKREDRSLSEKSAVDKESGKPIPSTKPEVRDTTKPASNEKGEVRESEKSVQSDKTEESKEYVASPVFNEDVDWDKEIDF